MPKAGRMSSRDIEALVISTDAVVTDQTAMAENLRRFAAGKIIPQNDPAALAKAIRERLLHPPTQAERDATRERVLEWVSRDPKACGSI